MRGLTQKQRNVLDVFRSRAEAWLPPPTTRELCAMFDVSSTNAILCRVAALDRKGYLVRNGVNRCVSLTEKGKRGE